MAAAHKPANTIMSNRWMWTTCFSCQMHNCAPIPFPTCNLLSTLKLNWKCTTGKNAKLKTISIYMSNEHLRDQISSDSCDSEDHVCTSFSRECLASAVTTATRWCPLSRLITDQDCQPWLATFSFSPILTSFLSLSFFFPFFPQIVPLGCHLVVIRLITGHYWRPAPLPTPRLPHPDAATPLKNWSLTPRKLWKLLLRFIDHHPWKLALVILTRLMMRFLVPIAGCRLKNHHWIFNQISILKTNFKSTH